MDNLDALLHQPLRTRIAAYLAGAEDATFSELKRSLEVSDGNLESHLKKLIAAEYVAVRKDSSEGRTQSCYALTPTGRAALYEYVSALQRLLAFDAAPAAKAPPISLKPRGAS